MLPRFISPAFVRHVLPAIIALFLALRSFALTATPSTTEGPYYPFNSGQTLSTSWITGEAADNDLTHLYGTSVQCSGNLFLLSGTLVDSNGSPIAGASIELWHADNGGIYYYVASTNNYSARDTNFQPFGACTTDASGNWSFRTIKPGLYTGRIRHFHFKVKVGGVEKLTSQFMFSEDSASFSSDGIAAPLVAAGTMSLVTLTPTTGTDSSGNTALIASKQIVLSGTYSTSSGTAPAISSQPASLTVTAGSSATFTVVATGTAPLSYQWYKAGTAISSATASSYTLASAAIGDAVSYYVVVSNSTGSATSNPATLTVNLAAVAPTITTQPTSLNVTAGNSVTFTVAATGTAPLSYQWYKGGAALSGATSASYSISFATTADAGTYYAKVSNSAGSATSANAVLTVSTPSAGSAPTLLTQPASTTVARKASVTFTVAAQGIGALSYQWSKDGASIKGATAGSYGIDSVKVSDAGSYSVVVSNAYGAVTSNPATLTVTSPALVNLSVRSYLPSSTEQLTAGFVVQSATGKRLLIRAIGPTLASFGVDGITDPQLEIFDASSNKISENAGCNASLAGTFASLGAFALPSGSKDAALTVTLPAGVGTAQVRGSSAGVALVEAYDATASTTSRLVNVSARAPVGSGDNALVAGFVIQGGGELRLLVRGIGPQLSQLGVLNALADPTLAVYDSAGKLVASNDNWDAALASTFAASGAFGLARGSKDAALVVTLPSGGSYTAVLSSATGATGDALIELYELP